MSIAALAPRPAFDGREVSRWLASFAIVLGVHVLVLAALLAYRTLAVEPGDALPAVMIDMAPPPAAPTAAPAEMPPSEAVPEAAMPDPVLDAPPEVPEPDIAPPIPPPVITEPPPDVPPPVVEKAEVVVPKPIRAEPPPPKPEKKVEVKKPPKPVQAKRAERQEARRPPAQEAGARTTASIATTSSGSSAASRASWQGALVSHLRRHLLPQGGQTGSASVRFTVDRGGRVLSAALVASAGNGALDSEALAVFRRSQPLPAPPSEVPGGPFTFTIPIRFTAR